MTEMTETYIEKRRYPRVKAPIYYRPASSLRDKRKVVDVSLGGMRINTHDYLEEKNLYPLEILLPNNRSIMVNTQVRWKKTLPPGSAANYDVGLEFINPSPFIKYHLNLLIKQTTS